MNNSPFAAPAAASGFDYKEHIGRLLVIEPHSVEEGVPTSLGDKDAIRADIHVIDGETADYADILVFPRVLQGQLRSRLGQKVIGRLEQGQARPGQNPPWRIAEASEADVQAGVTWLNSQQTGQLAQPAATGQSDAGNPPF